MRRLRQLMTSAHPELTSELRARARAVHEEYVARFRLAPRRHQTRRHQALWWLLVGWWQAPASWSARTVLRLVCWPVALRRVLADRRLRRERTFWRAIARTSTEGP